MDTYLNWLVISGTKSPNIRGKQWSRRTVFPVPKQKHLPIILKHTNTPFTTLFIPSNIILSIFMIAAYPNTQLIYHGDYSLALRPFPNFISPAMAKNWDGSGLGTRLDVHSYESIYNPLTQTRGYFKVVLILRARVHKNGCDWSKSM